MTDNDYDLLCTSQRGDRAALEALYTRYLPSVWRYAYARLRGDWHAAEDVVSETFLAAVRALGDFNPRRGAFGPWLIGIARHKMSDQHRRKERAGSPVLLEFEAQMSVDNGDPPTSDEVTETGTLVAAVLSELADHQRLVLEWKYIDELSVREIAMRLGRTEKAAEALLFRARGSFRALAERAQGVSHDKL